MQAIEEEGRRPSQQVSIDFTQSGCVVCVAMEKLWGNSTVPEKSLSKNLRARTSELLLVLAIKNPNMPLRQNACLSCPVVYICKYPAEPAVGFKKPEEALWGILSGYCHWMLAWPLDVGCWMLGFWPPREGACQLQWGFGFGLAISLDKCAAGSLV